MSEWLGLGAINEDTVYADIANDHFDVCGLS
jgi:hypothetical protein